MPKYRIVTRLTRPDSKYCYGVERKTFFGWKTCYDDGFPITATSIEELEKDINRWIEEDKYKESFIKKIIKEF